MHAAIALYACLLLVSAVWGKPYQTPLIGTPGGKRTLVVLDDMVGAANWTTCKSCCNIMLMLP